MAKQASPTRMEPPDSKKVLWRSVSALMTKRYGKENLTRLASDAKIGPGTCSRMKAQDTSVGLEVIDKLAILFDVQPWELLVPTFDPDNRPTLQAITAAELELYKRIAAAVKSA